jgi:hypothetical protein
MRKIFLLGVFLLSIVCPGYSQFLSWGIEGGLPLNDAVNVVNNGVGTVTASTDRWIVGPTVQLGLPFRLSVEVDALYRSEGFNVSSPGSLFSNSVNNWQFPFLARYDLHGGVIRPFVDAGVTYRHLSGATDILHPDGAGFTIGGGISLKLLFLRLSPEIRYTRWNNADVLNSTYATQSQNQADFLVGFTF